MYALWEAVKSNNIDQVDLVNKLINKCVYRQQAVICSIIIISAVSAFSHSCSKVKTLIKEGINPSQLVDTRTVLHLAAEKDLVEVCLFVFRNILHLLTISLSYDYFRLPHSC